MLPAGEGFELGEVVKVRPRLRMEQRWSRFEDRLRRDRIDRIEDEVARRAVAFVGVSVGFAAEVEPGGVAAGVGAVAGYVDRLVEMMKEAEQMVEKRAEEKKPLLKRA